MIEVFCKECGAKGVLMAGEVSLSCEHKTGFYVPFKTRPAPSWLSSLFQRLGFSRLTIAES